MDKIYPTRPKYKETKYVDYDNDTALWGIFGLESGFCYSTHASEEDANNKLKVEEDTIVASTQANDNGRTH